MHHAPILEIGGFHFDLSIILVIVLSCLITFILARLAVRNLSVDNPSKMQNFMEWVIEFVQNTIASTMPLNRIKPFVSLGVTLIMFIFVSNILGLPLAVVFDYHHPVSLFGHELVSADMIQKAIADGHEGYGINWFKSPTADLSVTAGLALIVIVLVHFLGLTKNTKHYLKHYFEPFPIFFPLNLIKEISKPVTLALRLYANIFAGEILVSTIIMAGFFGIPLLVVWQGFSLFVGGIQAFLFTILTMVYISQAAIHVEDH
ncbi:F0F1 ATP synthase subunit A [Gorillibacterium sp. sgz5001074]|uniref:F0F1 ATP synthase subunit A n=1 Tax=Gorillibacterium sp. sgz5001074 TaxID=3446695 RepID=UPI003F66D32A